MFYPRFALDHKYTNFGRVIAGMDIADAIARGEPPKSPTKIVQASLASEGKAPPPPPALRQRPRPSRGYAEQLAVKLTLAS